MFPDAIDVLEGRVTVLDCNLDIDEMQKKAYVDALTNALKEIWGDRKVGDDVPENWDQMTDNYLSFIMENFSIELGVYAGIQCLRRHGIDFNSHTDVFDQFFGYVQKYIV